MSLCCLPMAVATAVVSFPVFGVPIAATITATLLATYKFAPAKFGQVMFISNKITTVGTYVSIGYDTYSAVYRSDNTYIKDTPINNGLKLYHDIKDTTDLLFGLSVAAKAVLCFYSKSYYAINSVEKAYLVSRLVLSGIDKVYDMLYKSPTYTTITCETECCPGTMNPDNIPNNEIIMSYGKGTKIFGKGGLDQIHLNNSVAEKVYFSMCSTKIVPGIISDFDSVATIYNFDTTRDSISLFCTLKPFEASDIKEVSYQPVHNFTYIGIEGKFEETAIALQGHYTEEDVMSSIVYNERYAEVC